MQKTNSKNKRFSWKILNKVLGLAIIALGIFYLAGANDLAIKGFALNELKSRRDKLADENNKLELRAMALSSYGAVREKVKSLKMVAAGNVAYIAAAEAVAVK